MNKKELIDLVAQKGSLTKVQAGLAVDAVFESISESLIKGEDFTLIGFGKLGVRHRAERQGRNPANGQTFTIPPTNAVYFRVGKSLKDDVAAATPKA